MDKLIPTESIAQRIFLIRRKKVMLDSDLAGLFGVQTKHLNRQVKRNLQRFPEEFMFRVSKEELKELVPIWHQFNKMKHSYVLPYAFTEHGVAMLATILKSEQAIKISIIIVKTFIKLREVIATHKELACKLKELESRVEGHDQEIKAIIEAIRQLMAPLPEKPKRRIGFHADES